jgi:hypothetical protein
MTSEHPPLNRCPKCRSTGADFKCVEQDGILTFMLHVVCPVCGFTTEDAFPSETKAANAWNAIPEEAPPIRMRDMPQTREDDPAREPAPMREPIAGSRVVEVTLTLDDGSTMSFDSSNIVMQSMALGRSDEGTTVEKTVSVSWRERMPVDEEI